MAREPAKRLTAFRHSANGGSCPGSWLIKDPHDVGMVQCRSRLGPAQQTPRPRRWHAADGREKFESHRAPQHRILPPVHLAVPAAA